MPPITHELKMSRIFDAPRPLVWKVWTDPKHLRQWWGPFGPEHTSCEMDFRVGGEFSVMMKARNGESVPARAAILEIIEPERIVYEGAADAPTACGAGLPPRARITVLFEDLQAKTRLTVETVFPDALALSDANAAGYTTSWNKTLDDLRARVASGEFSAT